MPWADTESGPSNVRDKATSRLFDTRTMSLVSDNTDQSCKLQITGHSSVDGRDKCLKSRETAIADKWNLSRKLACQMDEYATLLANHDARESLTHSPLANWQRVHRLDQ